MNLWERLSGRGKAAPAVGSEPMEPLLLNAYATVRELPPLAFPHTLKGRRDRTDPDLAPHLDGFVGYVMGRGDGAMTAARYHLWRHLQRVRHHVSLEATSLPDVEAWARSANAVLFLPDGSVRAPDLAVLLSAEGTSDPAAALPYPSDAVARRARTLHALSELDPRPPAGMPPSLGEAEVGLHAPEAVLGRALALFHVAAHGQAHGTDAPPIPAGQRGANPLGAATLTPHERELVDAATPEQAVAMSWRYEAANTLLWALGVTAARMSDSERMIDVDALWADAAPLAQGGPAADALHLRPAGEILDALDRTWREHWIVRQARQKGVPLVGLSGDIVAERHVALNWLTGFQNDPDTPWDAIDTPT